MRTVIKLVVTGQACDELVVDLIESEFIDDCTDTHFDNETLELCPKDDTKAVAMIKQIAEQYEIIATISLVEI